MGMFTFKHRRRGERSVVPAQERGREVVTPSFTACAALAFATMAMLGGNALIGEPAFATPSPAVAAKGAFPGANGQIAFVSSRDGSYGEIYVMNPDGSAQTRLTDSPAYDDTSPSWSPDGSKIAFASAFTGVEGFNYDIVVMDADGANPIRLTDANGQENSPSWSPDGTKIAFGSFRDGNSEVYVMNADGSDPRDLTNNDAADSQPSWSPDGTRIAFTSSRDAAPGGGTPGQIYVMNADGTGQTRLTNDGNFDTGPTWSPDGTKIAFASSPAHGNYDIYVMDADGANRTRLTTSDLNESGPSWSPDGTQIAFTSWVKLGSSHVFVMNADGSNPTNLTPVTDHDSSPAWATIPPTPPARVQRLFGPDAIDTSIQISQASFPSDQSANAVVLARFDFFSDALAGGPLAASKNAPLLITPGAQQSSDLEPRVSNEIQRVLPRGKVVYILGGPLALAPDIDATLTSLGYTPVRVAGPNLYATAVAIAYELDTPSTIFESTGLDFPDALSAVPAAIKTRGAILLTNGTTQAPETADYLAAHPTTTRYAIGGPLAAYGADPSATPVYGDDLFDTSAAVARQFFPTPDVFGIATGLDYPDALSGGVFMATHGRLGPVLLVETHTPIPSAINDYLGAFPRTPGYIFGGPLAVGDDVEAAINGS